MNPAARPAFANLLANLGTGVLRIGGSSQDLMPYDPAAPNTLRVITPDDLAAIRATLEATAALDPDARGVGRGTPGWGTILGTALAPPEEDRPWVGPEHAVRFSDGAAQVFAGAARRAVVSVGLGNEPDLTYGGDLAAYLADLAAYTSAGAGRPFAVDLPSTSEPILPWQTIAGRSVPTRFFWDWPAILDAVGPATKAIRASAGLATTDHFYPMARGCASDEYRCATIERLLVRGADGELRLPGPHARGGGDAARPGLPARRAEHRRRARRGRREQRRRQRDLGAGRDVHRRLPAAARPAGHEQRLRHRRDRRELPQRRGQPVLGARGGQRVLQRDRLRSQPRRGRAERRAGVLRAAAVRALRAGHARAVPGSGHGHRPGRRGLREGVADARPEAHRPARAHQQARAGRRASTCRSPGRRTAACRAWRRSTRRAAGARSTPRRCASTAARSAPTAAGRASRRRAEQADRFGHLRVELGAGEALVVTPR